MGAAGAHAVLVGEALVTAPDIAARVRELSSQPREVER
jgi:indole-3-glycerol phosphate synthase